MARQNTYQFTLMFDVARISEWAARYSFREDTEALEAGKRIRDGQYTLANLQKIYEWKTKGRGRSRLLKNSGDEISDAMKLAASAKTDRAAVAVLLGLNGVQIPVASAILTAINPERYTIIDFRALQAPNNKNSYITVDFYLAYLSQCRRLSRANNVSLRTLDRALWQWSKDTG